MTPDYEAMVRAFHAKIKQPHADGNVAFRTAALRMRLVTEEALELCDAIDKGDMVEAVDGIADLLYVTFGTAIAFGVNIGKYFEEVHRTNMAKVPGEGDNLDGKAVKPEGWEPPKIAEMLAEDGWF